MKEAIIFVVFTFFIMAGGLCIWAVLKVLKKPGGLTATICRIALGLYGTYFVILEIIIGYLLLRAIN